MGPIRTLDDILDMLRRRARLIFFVIFIGSIAAIVFALKQPHLYFSTEVIQIERPQIANELAPTTIEGSSARRLQLVQQQVMSRETILDIIAELGLYADLPALTDSEKVGLFRSSVTIEGIAAAQEGGVSDGTVSALTISAMMGSPEHAQAVAHEIGARTIELSASARREKASATLEFFVAQEKALDEAIAALEKELATYRTENETSLTGASALSQAEFTSLNEAILAVQRNRITLQQELDSIDRSTVRPATQRRIEQLELEIQSLDEQETFLEDRIANLRNSMTASPEVERQVGIFQSRLEQYQDQREIIAAHRADAEIGDRLEANRQAERLVVLDPAILPDYPAEPSRKKLALMGIVASVMAALGLSYLLELCNPVIRSSAQLQREVGITPAVTIPNLKLKRRRRTGPVREIVTSLWRAIRRRPGART